MPLLKAENMKLRKTLCDLLAKGPLTTHRPAAPAAAGATPARTRYCLTTETENDVETFVEEYLRTH